MQQVSSTHRNELFDHNELFDQMKNEIGQLFKIVTSGQSTTDEQFVGHQTVQSFSYLPNRRNERKNEQDGKRIIDERSNKISSDSDVLRSDSFDLSNHPDRKKKRDDHKIRHDLRCPKDCGKEFRHTKDFKQPKDFGHSRDCCLDIGERRVNRLSSDIRDLSLENHHGNNGQKGRHLSSTCPNQFSSLKKREGDVWIDRKDNNEWNNGVYLTHEVLEGLNRIDNDRRQKN